MNEHGGSEARLEPSFGSGLNEDDWNDPAEVTKSLPVRELFDRRARMLASPPPSPAAPAPELSPSPLAESAISAPPETWWTRARRDLRETSLVRKAIALVVLVLVAGSLGHLVSERRRIDIAAATARRAKPRPEPVPSIQPSAAPLQAGIAEGEPASRGGPESGLDPTGTLPPGTSTLQRSAVDAMAAGDFKAALERYRELAKSDPSVRAYREACRILEARAALTAKEAW